MSKLLIVTNTYRAEDFLPSFTDNCGRNNYGLERATLCRVAPCGEAAGAAVVGVACSNSHFVPFYTTMPKFLKQGQMDISKTFNGAY